MKNLINEAKRMQQLAGIIKESSHLLNEITVEHTKELSDKLKDKFDFKRGYSGDQTISSISLKGDNNILGYYATDPKSENYPLSKNDPLFGKQIINVLSDDNELAKAIKSSQQESLNENPSPNYNELVNAMETALKNYIKNAKGDPNVTLGGQLSTEEGEVVAKLVNLIKQVKQDSKYTIKEPGVDQLTEIRQLVRETINEVIKSGTREMWADIKDALANGRKVTVDDVEIVKAIPGMGAVRGANGELFRIQTPEYLSKPDKIKIEDINGEMKSPVITLYSDTELDKMTSDYIDRTAKGLPPGATPMGYGGTGFGRFGQFYAGD